MKKYVREDKGIKISRQITKLNLKIEKAYILLSQKLMREPTTKELSNYLNIDEYYIVEALKSTGILQSIDGTINQDGKEITLHEIIPNKELDINTLIALKQELTKLKKDEYDIIKDRYINDLTQTEVANNLGMSQVQVSRKEQKVLKKLKKNLI